MKKFGFATVVSFAVLLFVVSSVFLHNLPQRKNWKEHWRLWSPPIYGKKNVRLFTLLKWVKKEYRLTCQHARHPICRPDKNQNRRKVE